MLIKRVAIQGFKTFAKRTEFIFDPGVTAIVGPNGSGKSNVVDAIRWCLGEQSFSLLRSKKTSDVIFSGSDAKARLGMAQVSLTLDNSQGDLPIDFAEIEITRRAYRDGENEYLLNGRRVRLQDITELLAETGLGRRTYALIGQGLIDKVLSLAPEELRSLFEEAAGITGYQAKRSMTLRRLEATQQNLTRVQDIVAELSPRLSYLRKQAERARERDQIARDLRDLLRGWYGYHWHHTLHELQTHHAEAAQIQARVDAGRQALSALGGQIEQARGQQGGLRGDLGDLHRQSSDLHRSAEQTGRDLAVAQERLRQLQARQEEARRDLAPLRLQQETVAARLADTQHAIVEAEALYRTQQALVDQQQAQIDQHQQERTLLQTAQADARRRLDALQAAQAETSARVRSLHERRADLEAEQQRQVSAHAGHAAEARQIEEQLARQETALAGQEQHAQTLRGQIAALETQRQTLVAALDQAQQARQTAERDLDRLQTRHDLLARLQREGAGYASGVRAVLQAAHDRDRSLSGLLGTVASLIRVPAHLDKAIETALGGALQHVVAERWTDAQAAIEYLKRTRQGRATFLPLDRLVTAPPLAAPRRDGILGNAADLVSYDPVVDEAAQQLLNRVWVAQDLTSARAALDAIRSGPRPTVVTLDGDIVRPGGAVSGGSDHSRRDDSILARERELRQLPAQLADHEDGVAQQTAACHDLTARSEAIALQLAPLQDALQESARQDRLRRSQIEETRRRLDRSRQTERWHGERLGQIAAEQAKLAQEAAGQEVHLQTLNAGQATAQAALHAAEAALEQAAAADLLRQMADLRTAAAEARATWQSRQALLDSQQRTLYSVAGQIEAKAQQIAALAAQEQTLAQQIAELATQETAHSQTIQRLRGRIDPLETRLAQLERDQAALEQQERRRQDALRTDEALWNTSQLHLQRTDDRLRQLRHDIEQDLGLVLLETGQELAYQPPLPWDSVVENLQAVDRLPEGLDEEIRALRGRLNRVNNVNPDAPREYAEAAERHKYLLTQSNDLEAAIADLRKVLRELDEVMQTELSRTFAAVSEQFVIFFQQLFSGGTAKLVLADPEDISNSGIEIIARPPGKRPQSLALLSGGERTLTACALIFAILRVSPTPFCVLDEVDAALDEANVDRFRQTIDELAQGTQFILITHNRRTLEGTNAIYGITMSSDGASRVISLRLEGERIVQQRDGDAPDAAPDQSLSQIEEMVKM